MQCLLVFLWYLLVHMQCLLVPMNCLLVFVWWALVYRVVGAGLRVKGTGLRGVGAIFGEAKVVRTGSLSPWEPRAVEDADVRPSGALHKARIQENNQSLGSKCRRPKSWPRGL
jgi:hypothetical protein